MINQIHQLIFRPENGWDPVPISYTKKYASRVHRSDVDELFVFLDKFISDYENLKVLDLGGGPGDFSVEFSKKGADVVWYDVSHNYQTMASKRAASESVNIDMMLGYLDEVPDFLNEKFDLVFNRVCWYYASSDKKFGRVLSRLVRPGGLVFVETNNETCRRSGLLRDFQYFLSRKFHWKIGHPYPPSGRVEKILSPLGLEVLEADYRRKGFDKVIFRKKSDKDE